VTECLGRVDRDPLLFLPRKGEASLIGKVSHH